MSGIEALYVFDEHKYLSHPHPTNLDSSSQPQYLHTRTHMERPTSKCINRSTTLPSPTSSTALFNLHPRHEPTLPHLLHRARQTTLSLPLLRRHRSPRASRIPTQNRRRPRGVPRLTTALPENRDELRCCNAVVGGDVRWRDNSYHRTKRASRSR